MMSPVLEQLMMSSNMRRFVRLCESLKMGGFRKACSNVGAEEILKMKASKRSSPKEVFKVVKPLLINQLSPELFARIKDIIPFHALNKSYYPKIITIQMKNLQKRLLTSKAIQMTYDKALIDYFAQDKYDTSLGVRALCEQVEGQVNDLLVQFPLEEESSIHLSIKKKNLHVELTENLEERAVSDEESSPSHSTLI